MDDENKDAVIRLISVKDQSKLRKMDDLTYRAIEKNSLVE